MWMTVVPLLRREVAVANDVVADGMKLAGVLVERAEGRTFVGIGINVRNRRRRW